MAYQIIEIDPVDVFEKDETYNKWEREFRDSFYDRYPEEDMIITERDGFIETDPSEVIVSIAPANSFIAKNKYDSDDRGSNNYTGKNMFGWSYGSPKESNTYSFAA